MLTNTNQRNRQQRVHKTKKKKTKTIHRNRQHIGYTRRRKTKQKQSRETGNIGYTRRRQTKHNTIQRNWQHRVHKTMTNKTKTQYKLGFQELEDGKHYLVNSSII
jgi:hypothetical protein